MGKKIIRQNMSWIRLSACSLQHIIVLCPSTMTPSHKDAESCINNSHVSLSRNETSVTLLDFTYNYFCLDALTKLFTNVDMFVLDMTVIGDWATIIKTPLINILVDSTGNLSCAIDVVDNTWVRGKRCIQCLPADVTSHEDIDLVVFDGAYNMQKAGDLLTLYFPRYLLIIGIEHTSNLVIRHAWLLGLWRKCACLQRILVLFIGWMN